MAREDVDIVDAALTIDDEEDVADLKQGQTSVSVSPILLVPFAQELTIYTCSEAWQ